jgi:serine protease Do
MAKEILNDLKAKGKVTRGWLGVSVQDITDDIAKGLKLKEQSGALVTEVFEGDPADKAGIKQGDIIKEVDGKAVRDTHELLRIVAMVPVGKNVNVKILRDGSFKEFQVNVAEREESKELASARKDTKENYGMTVQEVTAEIARRLGMPTPTGVFVTQVKESSAAEDAGIQPQDVILQINKVKINNLKDYQREIAKKTTEDRILLLIKRGRGTYYVAVKRD